MNLRFKHLALALGAAMLGALSVSPPLAAPPAPDGAFVAFDLVVDPHGSALAAWQVEVSAKAGDFQLVGLESGDGVFDAPPHYDPKALEAGQARVVVAAFSLAKAAQLPHGPARVASLHAFVKPGVKVAVKLVVATDENGKTIGADCALKEDGK